MVNFTPLVMPIDEILMQIKDDHALKWLRPLHFSPNVHDRKKYRRFHKDHGHNTKYCKDQERKVTKVFEKRRAGTDEADCSDEVECGA